jgi:hypothetical protein
LSDGLGVARFGGALDGGWREFVKKLLMDNVVAQCVEIRTTFCSDFPIVVSRSIKMTLDCKVLSHIGDIVTPIWFVATGH